jgi:membrane-associated phospholipid phosphatase
VVTAVALIWLFRRMPERYPLWRNTLAWTTALALIGFALYPLAPPRLMPGLGVIDTVHGVQDFSKPDYGTLTALTNQYAAMPSLHCGWALWVTFVLWPAARKPSAKLLVVLYPLITVFCIVVTANHYFLDAVGGAIVFCAGYGMAVLTVRHVTPLLARAPGGGAPPSSS